MSSGRFEVFLDSRAEKELEKLDLKSREHIMEQLRILRNGFAPELDIKKLKGKTNYYRLRVGAYRVIFTYRPANIIIVLVVRKRKTSYK